MFFPKWKSKGGSRHRVSGGRLQGLHVRNNLEPELDFWHGLLARGHRVARQKHRERAREHRSFDGTSTYGHRSLTSPPQCEPGSVLALRDRKESAEVVANVTAGSHYTALLVHARTCITRHPPDRPAAAVHEQCGLEACGITLERRFMDPCLDGSCSVQAKVGRTR